MAEEERELQESFGEDEQSQNGRKGNQWFLWLLLAGIGIYFLISRFGIHFIVNVIIVICGIGIIVIAHEFGHFIFAKLMGMKVEAFSVGFPPTLVGILRTGEGWRIRILPGLIKKKSDESKEAEESEAEESEEEGLLTFRFGKNKKAGETEYRIGLIPFGGYVKILGQEDIGKVKRIKDPRSYANKPVWRRMVVIAAGVVCNFALAVISSIIIFSIGIKQIPPIVGGVVANYPAQQAGLGAGDEIIEVWGRSKYLEFMDIMEAALLSDEGEEVPLKVRHQDGSIEEFKIAAKEIEGPIGKVKLFGIVQPQTLTIAKRSEEDARNLYDLTGLKPGDTIRAVNGKPVKQYWELEEIIRGIWGPDVTLMAERKVSVEGSEEKGEYATELVEARIPISFNTIGRGGNTESGFGEIYSMVPRLKIVGISKLLASANLEGWLRKGDVILAAADKENPTYKQLREVVEQYDGRELAIEVLRTDANGVEGAVTVNVVPRHLPEIDKVIIGISLMLDLERPVIARTVKVSDEVGGLDIPAGATVTAVGGVRVSSFYDIVREMNRYAGRDFSLDWQAGEGREGSILFGAEDWENFATVNLSLPGDIPFEPLMRLYKAEKPSDAVVMGYLKTISFMRHAVMTLRRFFEGQVDPKLFMGPVGIAKYGYEKVEKKEVMSYFYFFFVLVNVFIAVLNCLPLLPFDGGHFLFLVIEKVKGSPVRERIQTSLAAVGLILFLMLVVYITINDIMR